MLISVRGKNALALMMYLAEYNNGSPIRLKDVAERLGVSQSNLNHVSTLLEKHGLIIGYRGFHGGYRIRNNAGKYTVGMILRVTEGEDLNINALVSDEAEIFRGNDYITWLICKQVKEAVNKVMESISLQDLIEWRKEYSEKDKKAANL